MPTWRAAKSKSRPGVASGRWLRLPFPGTRLVNCQADTIGEGKVSAQPLACMPDVRKFLAALNEVDQLPKLAFCFEGTEVSQTTLHANELIQLTRSTTSERQMHFRWR